MQRPGIGRRLKAPELYSRGCRFAVRGDTRQAAALAFGALSAGEVLFEETFADAESTAKNWGQAGVAAFTADGFENGGLKIANDNPKGARLLPIKIDAAKETARSAGRRS